MGFAPGLWAEILFYHPVAHIHTKKKVFPRWRLWQPWGIWRQTLTQTHKTYAEGNIDFLFGITKWWATKLRGSGYSLDHRAQKQTILSSSLLLWTHSRHFLNKHSQAGKSAVHIVIKTPSLFRLNTSFSLLSPCTLSKSLFVHLSFSSAVQLFGWFGTKVKCWPGKHSFKPQTSIHFLDTLELFFFFSSTKQIHQCVIEKLILFHLLQQHKCTFIHIVIELL